MTDTDRLANDASIPADLAALVVLAAKRLNISLRWFRGPCRWSNLVEQRRAITKAARAAGYSYPAIGRALNRDHTTIMHHDRAGR